MNEIAFFLCPRVNFRLKIWLKVMLLDFSKRDRSLKEQKSEFSEEKISVHRILELKLKSDTFLNLFWGNVLKKLEKRKFTKTTKSRQPYF
jgi:hypothetical protein